MPVVFAYFSEFLPSAVAGRYLVYLAMFWMVRLLKFGNGSQLLCLWQVGALFTAGAAWVILEHAR